MANSSAKRWAVFCMYLLALFTNFVSLKVDLRVKMREDMSMVVMCDVMI